MNAYPLANDENGLPLEMPSAAVGWLVRRHNGGKGRPASFYDAEGRPLVLPLSATVADLRAAGCPPGAYRLDAVDDRRKLLNLAAYTELRVDDDAAQEAVPSKRDANDAVAAALARAVEGLLRVQFERERTSADRERAQVERERMLCENLVKLANRSAGGGATPTERVRNAVSEQRELGELLREQMAIERERDRRAAKIARRRGMKMLSGKEEEPSAPNWVGAVALASPLIGVAAVRLGQQFGLSAEQVTEIVKAASQAGAQLQSASGKASTVVSDEEDDENDDLNEDGDPIDEDDEAAASASLRNTGRPALPAPAVRKDEIDHACELIGQVAGVKEREAKQKLEAILQLLTPAERRFLVNQVSRWPKATVAAQLAQLQDVPPEAAVQLYRSAFGDQVRAETE